MPEKCILEAFGTGVPNGIVTVNSIKISAVLSFDFKGKHHFRRALEVGNRIVVNKDPSLSMILLLQVYECNVFLHFCRDLV